MRTKIKHDTRREPHGEEVKLGIRDERRPGWHWAYHEIIDEYGGKLGPHGLAIYYALCRHANENRECWPSYQTLAHETGMSRRQAIREVGRLLAMGFIGKVSRFEDKYGDQDTNLYVLLDPTPQKGGGDRQSPPNGTQSLGVVNTSHQGGDRESPKGEPSKDNHHKDDGGAKDTDEFLRTLGLNAPLLTEIANSHDLNWCRAAASEVDRPGGIVHLHRQGWQPTGKGKRAKPRRGSREDRYRYFKGEYADYLE